MNKVALFQICIISHIILCSTIFARALLIHDEDLIDYPIKYQPKTEQTVPNSETDLAGQSRKFYVKEKGILGW